MAPPSDNGPPAKYRLPVRGELADASGAMSKHFVDLPLLRRNAVWFCRLRWIVVLVFALAGVLSFWPGLVAEAGLALTPAWPLTIAAVLVVCNFCYLLSLPGEDAPRVAMATRVHVWVQIVGDLMVLTTVVHFLGSTETQASFMYLFHIILSCIFLSRIESLLVMLLAGVLYVTCLMLEATGVIATVTVFSDVVLPYRRAWPPSFWFHHLGFTFAIWGIIWYLTSGLSSTLRQREQELVAANFRLKASIEERMRHMLQTTHQLKAPFAAIHANTQLLQGGYCGELPDRAGEVIVRIARRCTMISQQIIEMLQLANLRSEGQSPPPRVDLDLVELIESCVVRLEPNARPRHIQIETDLQPARVRAVEDHLKMLVDNLLSNAINYSYEHGKVQVASRSAARDAVILEVRDEGIGIPAEKLPRIFDDHFRTSEAVQHNNASTGLGLAIVRDVAWSLGIAIDVESAVGRGTRFRLTIPTGAGAAETAG